MSSLLDKLPTAVRPTEWPPAHTIVLEAAFLLFATIVSKMFYNIYLHPLRHIPGPKLAAASPLWFSYNNIGGRYPFLVKALHDKYGPVVRVGPKQLSFNSAASWRDIYGQSPSRKFFLKSDFYDMEGGGTPNLDSDRNPVSHARVRKVMAPAFSHRAVAEVEPVVQGYVDKFVQQLGKVGAGKDGINVCRWYLCATFDIVADLAFGSRYNSLETGEPHFWILMLVSNIRYMILLGEIYRLLGISVGRLMRLVPKSWLVDFNRNLDYTAEMVTKKIESPEPEKNPDFLSPMISALPAGTLSIDEIRENAGALVIGGTETLTTFFSSATYYLTTHPQVYSTLATEIRTTFPSYTDITASSVEKLPYLNAVIYEVFRIFPSTAFGLPRISPGETVDGLYVPAGVEVFTTAWAATHAAENFHKPYTFAPERWLPGAAADEKYAADKKDASQPFLLGPRNCIGRYLAWMEMRLILTKLLYVYDMERTRPEQDWVGDARHAVFWLLAPLEVRFVEREGVVMGEYKHGGGSSGLR